jgi:hypothetical protein
MPQRFSFVILLAFLATATVASAASAAEIGRIKATRGDAHIQRDGQRVPAVLDTAVRATDTVVTGADGSVGITFTDNSRVSAGPNSVLVLSRYSFDPVTHAGSFDATLTRGTLAVVSGRMAKQSPEAMRVRTPTMVLGVRGTEFLVYAE